MGFLWLCADGVLRHCQDVRWNITLKWNGYPNVLQISQAEFPREPNGHYSNEQVLTMMVTKLKSV